MTAKQTFYIIYTCSFRMELEEKEVEHLIELFAKIKQAIIQRDSLRLNELSNHTIHHSCAHQDEPSITIAVLVYALSKIIERHDDTHMKNWDKFLKQFTLALDHAAQGLQQRNYTYYEKSLKNARKELTSLSVNLQPYLEEVIRKASINKGSKLYEHGISFGQAARTLGITDWELSSYIGQKDISSRKIPDAEVKKRAQRALKFFS